MIPGGDVRDRLAAIRERIARAAERAGRDPASITLVAASKTQTVEVVRAAFEAGVRVFGENRVQEGAVKVPALPDARWLFIGRLQRNKARRAVELFEEIHSVDSLRLAETLARLGVERGRPVPALLEVNVGGEESKGGFAPEELPAALDALAAMPGLAVRGLMTIPPPVDDPAEARPAFRRVAALAREAAGRGLPGMGFDELSMGMSDDFEVAIEEGATLVRLGTVLFGARSPLG